MIAAVRRGLLLVIALVALLGGAYPLVLLAVGQVFFPAQSSGQFITFTDGRKVGSPLLAQPFLGDGYFHPRPSAVGHDPLTSGGTNWGPTSARLRAQIGERLANLDNPSAGPVPLELLTASGSGLDPHLSPEAARFQAPRVAKARNLPLPVVLALIDQHIEPPTLGLLGMARVNVLRLNLALEGRERLAR